MKVLLSKEEKDYIFYNALCNGLSYVQGYGLEVNYEEDHFRDAKKHLKEIVQGICFEDILMRILQDGNPLEIVDTESEESVKITIETVYERIENAPVQNLLNMINQQDDATDADIILQTVFYNEVIFG